MRAKLRAEQMHSGRVGLHRHEGRPLDRALLSLQKAQGLLLTAHCRLQDLRAAEVEQFWAVQGDRIEKYMHAAAVEVLATFQAFSAAGLVADAGNRQLVTEARRLVAEGG